ncbi:MAG: GGDEF domain-containing protein [Pirellulales bacterium]|nr:GGDEF domain-containing protein [Pirellulales bacterium]
MLLVLIVAVLNFGLGFALAYALAPSGHDTLLTSLAPWGALQRRRRTRRTADNEATTDESELDEPHSPAAPHSIEEEPHGQSSLESGLEELSNRLDAYRVQLSEADTQLHGAIDQDLIAAILEHLAPSHRQCQQALGAASKTVAAAGNANEIGQAIERHVQEFLHQVDSVDRRLAHLDRSGDAAATSSKIRDQLGQLLESSFELRDHVGEVQASVAEQEGRFGTVGRRARADRELTTLSRTGLEEELWLWWQNDPQHQRQLSLLVIDVDHCRRINSAYGTATGDRLLWGLARLLDEELRGDDRLARFSGQRFVLLLPDTGPHNAAALAERLRQRIEVCTFKLGELSLNFTVTCGTTEANSKDDLGSLLARLGEAVREAKQSGRNRTCVHDGKIISPVLPPSLRFSERTMSL